jgi:hypothetical protein
MHRIKERQLVEELTLLRKQVLDPSAAQADLVNEVTAGPRAAPFPAPEASTGASLRSGEVHAWSEGTMKYLSAVDSEQPVYIISGGKRVSVS